MGPRSGHLSLPTLPERRAALARWASLSAARAGLPMKLRLRAAVLRLTLGGKSVNQAFMTDLGGSLAQISHKCLI